MKYFFVRLNFSMKNAILIKRKLHKIYFKYLFT